MQRTSLNQIKRLTFWGVGLPLAGGFSLLFVECESYLMTLISGVGVVGSRQKGPEQGQPGWPLVNISLTVLASTASSLCPHFRLGLKKVPTS